MLFVRVALLAVGFFWTLDIGISYAQECTPPQNTTSNRVYSEGYVDTYCKSFNMNSGATVPIEGLPWNFSLSGANSSCKNTTKNVEQLISETRSYLATEKSLLVAECGFRMCELRRTGADSRALSLLENICLNVANPSAGSGQLSGVNLVKNIAYVEWDGDDATPLVSFFVRNNNASESIKVAFEKVDSQIEPVKRGPYVIPPNRTNPIQFRLKRPKDSPKRGKPIIYNFNINYKNDIIPAAIELYASIANWPNCVRWINDYCLECRVPFSFSAVAGGQHLTSGACTEMAPNLPVAVSMSLSVTDVGKRASDGTVWATFQLSSGSSNTRDGHDSRPIPAAYSLSLAPSPPSAPTGSTSKVVNVSKQATLQIERCTSGGDTNCTGKGFLFFRQQL